LAYPISETWFERLAKSGLINETSRERRNQYEKRIREVVYAHAPLNKPYKTEMATMLPASFAASMDMEMIAQKKVQNVIVLKGPQMSLMKFGKIRPN
jgi:hypothetical protein